MVWASGLVEMEMLSQEQEVHVCISANKFVEHMGNEDVNVLKIIRIM